MRRPLASPSSFKRLSELPEPSARARRYPSPGLQKTDEIPNRAGTQQWGKRPPRSSPPLPRFVRYCVIFQLYLIRGNAHRDKRAAGWHVPQRSDVETPTFAAQLRQYQSRSGRIRSLQKLCSPMLFAFGRDPQRLRYRQNGETVSTKISSITCVHICEDTTPEFDKMYFPKMRQLSPKCARSCCPKLAEEVVPMLPQLSVA